LPTYIWKEGARSGNLDMMNWLGKTLGRTAFEVGTLCAAAKVGHLEMVQYLHSQRCPWDTSVCAAAAAGDHREVLMWLKDNGYAWTDSVSNAAAYAGNANLLRWLIDAGCAWKDEAIIKGALHSNNIEILHYAQELGVVFNARTMREAARHSSLQAVQFLHESGCPWSADTWHSAFLRADHTVFNWLYKNGCPCDIDKVCRLAIMFSKVDIISVLHQQGSISDNQMTQLLNHAGVEDKLVVAHWLRQQGAQWPTVLGYKKGFKTCSWSGNMIAWPRANGCTSPIVQVCMTLSIVA
jgi:hypothetical protein